jgi:hypothetical protein
MHIESKGWKIIRISTEATHDPKNMIDAVRAVLPLPLRGGGRGRGEAQALEGSRAQPSDNGASPHPPAPSSLEEGEFDLHLRRRTRANRKLPPRRKR